MVPSYVDIVIPNEMIETAIMFIDGGDKDETYFRLDSVSVLCFKNKIYYCKYS